MTPSIDNPFVYQWGYSTLNAVAERLSLQSNLAIFDTITRDYQSMTVDGKYPSMYVLVGRAKTKDRFPVICVELASETSVMEALQFTRDVRVRLNIMVLVKVPGGEIHPATEELERYIARLAGAVNSILIMPGNLVYNDIDKFGTRIYDSHTEGIEYGYLYNGALRAAQFQWEGRIYLTTAAFNPNVNTP